MTEDLLLKELKQGIIRNVYYFYGKETFLVETYTKRVLDKCTNGELDDALNLIKFTGVNTDISALDEFVETLPIFADKRIAMINDLDADKLDAASLESVLNILSNVPESTCVIIHMTGIQPDLKKTNTKKLIASIEKLGKNAAILNFERMSEIKTAELIIKRASRKGCTISRENAGHLARLCLRNLTLIAAETDKLCAYADYKGEITRNSIDILTARQLDSGVFALASEITSKRGASALMLLDELIEQGNAPVMIMSSLSMAFIDFYRAKLGSAAGKRTDQIVKDFGYPPNRSWVVGKAMSAVSLLTAQKIRDCVGVLCDADYKLKSSPISDRIIMERAIARLLTLC